MEQYPDFLQTTGYKIVDGLHGASCRHSFSPFYIGVSTRRWDDKTLKEYADKKYTFTNAAGEKKTVDAYLASQIQRGLEREIRAWRRRIAVNKAAGIDDTAAEDRKKLGHWQQRLKTFCDETGLRRQSFREDIV